MKYLVKAAVLIIAAGLAGNLQNEALGYSQAEYEMLLEAQQELADGSYNLSNFRSPITLDDLLANYPDDEENLLAAKDKFEQLRDAPGLEEQAIEGLDETVYWLLKGAALLGNDHVVEAYRMRYDPNGDCDLSDEYAVFEDAVADYKLATGYLKDFAEYPQDFQTNSFKEMVNVLFRQGMARNEIAERRFALGADSLTQLKNAGQELRRCSQEAYLGAAVLTAIQDESGFQAYQVGRLRTNAVRAANTFKKMAAGLSAGGFHRNYIPFHPYFYCPVEGSLQYQADVESGDTIDGAIYWADEAKDAGRLVDEDEDALSSALSEIRTSVKDELDALSGGLTVVYFPDGANLDDPDKIADFAQAACQGTGDIGSAIFENAAAMAAFEAAYLALKNIPEKIKIEQERVGQIASVRKGTAEDLGALEIAKGFANAFSFSASYSFPGFSVGVNFNPGSIVTGFCDAEARMLEAMQEVQIEGIDSAATIKLLLLDMAEQALALREYEIRVKQTKLKIDNFHKRLLALVEEWGRSLEDVADAYFADPAYRLEMEDTVRKANIELEQAQVKCFLAARALGYDWADEFTGAALDPPYNQFDSSWSVFELPDALDVRDFYLALNAWDIDNRWYDGSPCVGSSEKEQVISLRQDILGFSDWTKPEGGIPEQYPPEVLEENKRLFKQYIRDHTDEDGWIRLDFGSSIADESLFQIQITPEEDATNAKIKEIAANLRGDLIVNPEEDEADVGLTLAGMSTVRQCIADYPENDSLVHYDLEALTGQALRTINLEPHIADLWPGEPLNWNDGLARLSIAATAWRVAIYKNGPDNTWLNWDELTDIQFKIKYTYGAPPDWVPCGDAAMQQEDLAEDANSMEPIDNEE